MKKSLPLIVLLLCISQLLFAQDVLKMMAYNVLRFPSDSLANHQDSIEVVLQYYQPDILMVCELKTEVGADLILNGALNENGIDHYARANFILNQSGANTELNNMLYYNSDKLALLEQNTILADTRDISEYILYYKNYTGPDTIFFDLYVSHLKASSGDQIRRKRSIDSLCNYLANKPPNRNRFFAGDFNLYDANEPAYTTLLYNCPILFNDPIDEFGNWHNNSNFAGSHTQSTRQFNIGDEGVPGGLDDRFDFILVSEPVMTGSQRVEYVPDSYKAYGNTGACFNQSIISCSSNPLPSSVVSALYHGSDHLPVVMEVEVDNITSSVFSPAMSMDLAFNLAPNPVHNQLNINFVEPLRQTVRVDIFDVFGRYLMTRQVDTQASFMSLDVQHLPSGNYGIRVSSNTGFYTKRFIKGS